ncbi:MAG: glutamate racemase [Oscillospiraceae bacterium]|nr:glutamate racemase [Oscillospiraceae bacterium]
MHSKEESIGVFDSGVGGISVLRELLKCMPQEKYLYFGDSANAPYGNKTTQQVRQLTMEAVQHLMAQGIKALVVACNTATAAAIKELRETYPNTIIVGIEPALKVASDHFPTGRVGIMATEVTLREEKLAHQLERFPRLQTQRIPAPGLVELIERGKGDSAETQVLLETILAPYAGKLDALVLGCTHYPFVKETIGSILGESTLLLDGGEGTARQTQRCLAEAGLLREGTGSVTIQNSLNDPEILQLSHQLLRK